ncbi:MAG: AHH domain-containing protein [Rhodopseudomonas palustris]|nr:AHH domain-containing protein [Rhodopseudomonas palustris]
MVPGGAGTAIKAYRAADTAMDAAKTIKGSKLARNLLKSGLVRNADEVAHHLVAQFSKYAPKARAKLKDLGIDINDAANGVFLPKEYHQSMHTKKYYDRVEEASEMWGTKADALRDLQKFRNELLMEASVQ